MPLHFEPPPLILGVEWRGEYSTGQDRRGDEVVGHEACGLMWPHGREGVGGDEACDLAHGIEGEGGDEV